MGNKINPNCYRLNISKVWSNKWSCLNNTFGQINLVNYIKNFIEGFCDNLFDNINIEMLKKSVIINIYSVNPNLILGKFGSNIIKIKDYIKKKYNKNLYLNIKEYKKIDYNFNFIFFNIIKKIKNRESYKYFFKQLFSKLLNSNILGIKIKITGRLSGSDISKVENYIKGKMPLQSYNKNIFFRNKSIKTKYGLIGIKIWINYKK